jgi:choline dehydrogenase-like flavoprotein
MIHPNAVVTGVYEEDIQSWNGPAGQLIYSLQFYETDLSRGFYRGAKWNLMPIPGVLNVLELYKDLPFEERWGEKAHEISRYAGKVLNWYANIDDLPEESNRVVLDEQLIDSSGLPAARVHYRLSENSRMNLEFSFDRMTEAHEAAGAANIFRSPALSPSGHLLGTARMGDDPGSSVVNKFGRSHDIPNLYIVDGSVMVTGGAMNPTATITALALRAAEHLADDAGNQRSLV